MSPRKRAPFVGGTIFANIVGRLIADPLPPEPHPNPLVPEPEPDKVVPAVDQSKDFAAGVAAHHRAARMDREYGEAYGLGEYVEVGPTDTRVRPRYEAEDLGGRAVAVKFPKFWRDWFARQTEQRLDELDEMLDERLEREAAARHNKRFRVALWAALAASFYFAKWIIDQAGFVVEKLPLIKQIWAAVVGR